MSGTTLTVQRNPTAINVSDYAGNLVPNGSADFTTIIQAALNQAHTNGGGTVLVPFAGNGNYVTSSPLIIYSNTTLNVNPCVTITLAVGSNCNMFKNASSVPSRTVTDAVTTAASTTVTSATANFQAGDVGKAVGVLGAGPNYGLSSAPGSLYGTIVTVNSTTSVTLSSAATSSVSAATLYVWPPRDVNINVSGGIWNHGNLDSIHNTIEAHCMLLRRVDGLKFSDMQFVSSGAQGIGGRDCFSIGDCTVVTAEILFFNNYQGSGVQFIGPGQYITVRDIRGTTGDDLVAFTGTDGQSQAGSTIGDVYGSFSDVLVENLQCNNAYTALKITSGIGSNNVANTISRFKARDIFGSTIFGPVNIVDYAGATTFSGEIENVSVAPGANQPLIKIAATNAGEVVLKGFKFPNLSTPNTGVIKVDQPVTSLIIKDLEFMSASATSGAIIQVNTTSISNLVIDGAYTPLNPSGTIHLVQFSTASTTVTSMRLSNIYRTAGGNTVNIVAASYTFTDVQFSNVYESIASLFVASADSANTVNIEASNCRCTGALIILQSPANIALNNVKHSQSGGAVRANSAAATPVRVLGSNTAISGGTLFTRTASQSLSANGITLSSDLSILTPTDQDIVNNSNGALSCGTGLCIFHTGGTGNGWKNIYSGSTY